MAAVFDTCKEDSLGKVRCGLNIDRDTNKTSGRQLSKYFEADCE